MGRCRRHRLGPVRSRNAEALFLSCRRADIAHWPGHLPLAHEQSGPVEPFRPVVRTEINVLLQPWRALSLAAGGRAMTWALEELLCRGHFVRVTDSGAGVPGRLVAYRVAVSPVPRSARPALASFAPLFDGHPRDITAQGLAAYVARAFGDEPEVEHGHPYGSPLDWYERCVVDPLRAEGLVRVTSTFLEPTADGEAVAARYRDILGSNRHRRDWRRPWRASAPVVAGDIDIAVTTLQRSERTRKRERVFVVELLPGAGDGDGGVSDGGM